MARQASSGHVNESIMLDDVPLVSPSFEQTEQTLASRRNNGPERHRETDPLRAESEHVVFEGWMQSMSDGHFEDAWHVNDARGRHWPSAHRLWNGRVLEGEHVSVLSLHGLGDAVQMLRYAPRLAQLARRIHYVVPAALLPLMPYFLGLEETTTACFTAVAGPSKDIELEMSELPYVFRTQFAELPLATKYLVLPEAVVAAHGAGMRFTNKRRIGVVWAGGTWDSERWVPLQELEPLLQDGRFEWWNLQGAPASAQAVNSTMKNRSEICSGGLLTLAATIAKLDLVLTVDTLAAHLAGALGLPTWLMLKHDADWRWMEARGDSPWYPSLRLFRQSIRGDWSGVLAAVRQALESSTEG